MEFRLVPLEAAWEELLPENCKDCGPLRHLAKKFAEKVMAGEIEMPYAVEAFLTLRDESCDGPDLEKDCGEHCGEPNCRYPKGNRYIRAKTAHIATSGIEELSL